MSGTPAVCARLQRPLMKLSEFLRIYPIRAKNLMWFLGADASSGARVPTATDYRRGNSLPVGRGCARVKRDIEHHAEFAGPVFETMSSRSGCRRTRPPSHR